MAETGKYESIFIVNATLDQEAIDSAVERFKSLVEANGTLEAVEVWGRRRLAYPIENMLDGFYVLMYFESPKDFPAELDRVYNITDAIVRSLIIARDEDAELPQSKKTAPAEEAGEPEEVASEEEAAAEEAAPADGAEKAAGDSSEEE